MSINTAFELDLKIQIHLFILLNPISIWSLRSHKNYILLKSRKKYIVFILIFDPKGPKIVSFPLLKVLY